MPTYAAESTLEDGKKTLVVVERLVRGGDTSDEEAADFVRDARRLAELEHPNIGRVRDVFIHAEDVVVASDWIDGERLSEFLTGKARPALEIVLRILSDVLTGLGALHNLRDVKRQPLKLIHGELTPANVVVGLDGTSRVVHACRVASQRMRPGRTGSGYLAPEILLADGTADQRADIYSVGAILWEALSGKPLFPDSNPHAIVAHLLSGKVPRATAPADAPWAAELTSLAERALAADPEQRFPTAASMVAEIRRVAGAKLATTGRVATFIKTTYGERIAARRAQSEAKDETAAPKKTTSGSGARPRVDAPARTESATKATTEAAPSSAEAWDIPVEEEPTATGDRPTAAKIPVVAPAPPALRAKLPSAPSIPDPPPAPRAKLPSAPGAVAAAATPPPARAKLASGPRVAEAPPPPVRAKIPSAPGAAAAPPHDVEQHTRPTPLVPPPASIAPRARQKTLVPSETAVAPPAPAPVAPPPPAPAPITPPPAHVAPVPVPVPAPTQLAPTPAPAPTQFAPTPAPAPPSPAFPPAFTPPPALAPVPTPAPSYELPAGVRPPRRRWAIVALVLAPCLVLLFWGSCRMLSRSEPQVAATTTAKPRPIPTTPPASTAPATSVTAVPTAAPEPSATTTTEVAASAPPEPSASAEPSASESSTPPTPHNFGYAPPPATTAKPKPHTTYDPEGI